MAGCGSTNLRKYHVGVGRQIESSQKKLRVGEQFWSQKTIDQSNWWKSTYNIQTYSHRKCSIIINLEIINTETIFPNSGVCIDKLWSIRCRKCYYYQQIFSIWELSGVNSRYSHIVEPALHLLQHTSSRYNTNWFNRKDWISPHIMFKLFNSMISWHGREILILYHSIFYVTLHFRFVNFLLYIELSSIVFNKSWVENYLIIPRFCCYLFWWDYYIS